MIDTDNMSDAELATCVDAYVQRAINRARGYGYTKRVVIMVYASSSYPNDTYDISHSITVGDYNEESKASSNNAIRAIDQLIPPLLGITLDKPTHVSPMLAAPVELKHEPEVEDADFVPF